MIGDAEAFESEPSADLGKQIRSTGSVRWEPLLSADDECELADRMKGGDQAARRQLVLANLRVVVEITRGYRSGRVPLDDLIQEGNLGLIRASRRLRSLRPPMPFLHLCGSLDQGFHPSGADRQRLADPGSPARLPATKAISASQKCGAARQSRRKWGRRDRICQGRRQCSGERD